MNVRMWQHAATRRNVAQLKADGVRVIEPAEGEMACGEFGPGRLPEPQAIMDQIADLLEVTLAGKHVLVTAGPDARADRSGASDCQPLVRADRGSRLPRRRPRRAHE